MTPAQAQARKVGLYFAALPPPPSSTALSLPADSAMPRKRKDKARAERNPGLRVLWRFLLQVLNVLLLVPVLLVALAPLVNPDNWWLPSILAFGAPLLVCIPVVFILIWNVRRWRWSLLNLVFLLMNLGHLFNAYGFKGEKPAQDEDFNVVTYNVDAFNYDADHAERTIDYLRTLKPDILCLQEFSWEYGTPPMDTRKYIQKTLGLRYMAVVELLPDNRFGMAIFSRYPIVDYGEVTEITRRTRNGAMYADIKFFGEVLRVYNVHLQSYQLSNRNRQLLSEGPSVIFQRSLTEMWSVAKILLRNWRKQLDQLLALHQHRSSAGQYTLMCGDLNNPPFNYIYRKARRDLHDSFRGAAQGFGVTYPGRLHGLRIDYIFRSDGLRTVNHYTGSHRFSDHKPVLARMRFDFHQ